MCNLLSGLSFKLVQTRVIVNKVENKPFSLGLALAKVNIDGDKPVSDVLNSSYLAMARMNKFEKI